VIKLTDWSGFCLSSEFLKYNSDKNNISIIIIINIIIL
jgi:hypothetical protein